MIALITTSPFFGLEQIEEVTIPSLQSQTCQDFTWYYFDGYHKHNKIYFEELKNRVKFKIYHLPLLHAQHYPHDFKWEPYNSALCVIQEKYFLRFGRFRKYHPRIVELALQCLNENKCLNLEQSTIDNFADFNQLFNNNITTVDTAPYFRSSCGMFAIDKESLIYKMNGNDEVGLHWFHFEDTEMSRRGLYANIPTTTICNGLIRYSHNKNFRNQSPLDNQVSLPIDDKWSIFNLRWDNPVRANVWTKDFRIALEQSRLVKIFDYEGMLFGYSEFDNSIIPCGGDTYLEWISERKKPKSPVGINGLMIGRNIVTLYEETQKLSSVESRVQFIQDNFTNSRYYL